ncbi:MAG: DUF4212 domain-containing protein [Natronospirillum sp.]|uniref:DUF4212 domain-containing protein n=1 Tax=Natronospirillum sp. TaxID=2812955 RepID=UPI0025E6EE12|nr:DUF4212 domain-containing protein [Natronospirillum sp.]MCH8550981.1 DUF4212 domain-containing protein [Natronospirillum sp.]
MSEEKNSQHQEDRRNYWRTNLRVIFGCLIVWALVSLGLGIVWAEPLNALSLGGYPLGFWFAQQGSIYTFLVLIFFYAWRMNKLDKEFNVDEE